MEFEDDLNEEEIHAEWARLHSAIEEKQTEAAEAAQMSSVSWKRYLSIAAVVAGIILVSGLFFNSPSHISYATAYGEQRRVELPDGSLAVLNSNSSLKFKSNWQEDGPREVEVNGEVFFSVVHTSDDRQFLVYTSKGMLVEVLGTEFNVYERNGMQRVVLNSGSVQLSYGGPETHTPIIMEPGEMTIRRAPEANPEKMKVNTSRYSSWVSGQLVFENTPVGEVCRIMEDDFGITVALGDTVLKNRLFNGTFPADDPEILVRTLMVTYNLELERSGNSIKLTRK